MQTLLAIPSPQEHTPVARILLLKSDGVNLEDGKRLRLLTLLAAVHVNLACNASKASTQVHEVEAVRPN